MKSKTESFAALVRAFSFLVLAVALAVVVAGCKPPGKSEPAGQVASNPAGSYALVSVDGKQVPCAVNHEGHSLTIKSGVFTINSDGTCSSKMVFTPPNGSEATREVKATYKQEGAKLTMKWEGAGTTEGSVTGDTFTMNNEGMVLAFRK